MSSVSSVITAVYESPLATAIRESDNFFPILQTFHIIGTIAVAGAIAILDLRLLQLLCNKERPAALAASLLPITWIGFGVMLISGGLLFAAQSARIYSNIFLQAKLALLLAAVCNVVLFHATTFRDIKAWDDAVPPPPSAKIFAALSLLLWSSVVVTGRFIAYY